MTHLLLLSEIGRIVSEARTLQEVLDGVTQLVTTRMQTDVCSIYLLDGTRTKLTLMATEGLAHEAIGRATLNKGEGLTWQVLERMGPVLVEDAPRDPHYFFLPVTHEEPFHSYLGLPLLIRGAPIGVINVQSREPRIYVPDEVRALSAIASQIAPVVDNARLLNLVAGGEHLQPPAAAEGGPRQYSGTPCSIGVVCAPLLRLDARPRGSPPETGSPARELDRLRTACAEARSELLKMQEWLRERNAEEAALVFSAQLMMLEDPAFEGRMRTAVEGGLGAWQAVEKVTEDMLARFATLQDHFFRERAEDVQDLAGRLLRHVRAPAPESGTSLKGKVVVLPLLGPSRLVSLCAEGVAAVLAGGGGATGHAALLARSLDLPLVVGLGDFIHAVRDGERVLVDAASGEVVLDPPDAVVQQATLAAAAGVEALRDRFAGRPGSGRIRFEANVSLIGDAVRAREQEADGVGLYRTEFAFLMRPDLPGEDEQYALYRRVVETMAPRPVTFRLLDAGGDKLVPALGQAAEPNPFLGYRSLRLLLDHPVILIAQTRAILRALEHAEGRLLVPMVSSADEVRALKEILRREGLALPPLGAMVEVPSALLQLDEIAAESDFLCVGTNDLTQHLLGVDRTNARVTRFFDPCHPSLVRALHAVAAAARRAKKSLCICGEAASNPILLPLWLGLGVERLSVHFSRLRVLRALEADLDPVAARDVAAELRAMTSAREIRARLVAMAAPEVRDLVQQRRGL